MAWRGVVGDALGNPELRAVLEGFAESDRAAPPEPYASQCSGKSIEYAGIGPEARRSASWSISTDTIAGTDDHLDRPDVPAAHACLPNEARGEIARALRLLNLEDWTGTAR